MPRPALALVCAALAVACAPPLRARSGNAVGVAGAAFDAVPALDAPWSPPVRVAAGAGDWARMATALAGEARVRVQVHAGVALAPRELGAVVARLAPGVEVVTAGGEGLARLVLEPAPISMEAWAARPARTRGSCAPLEEALAMGQEETLAHLEPALARVTQAADGALRARLRRRGNSLAQTIEGRCPATARAVRQCMGSKPCPFTPRPVLRGAVWIAAPEPADADPSCGPEGLPGLWRAVEEAAEVAVRGSLAPQWADAADRQAARVALAEALADACTPSRRRFDPAVLAEVRAEVRLAGEDLRRVEPARPSRWETVSERVHVPGGGPMRGLLVLDTRGGPGPAARVRERVRVVRARLAAGARCEPQRASLPLRLVLRAPEGALRAQVLAYPEELVCEDLGPGVPEPAAR